MPPVPYRIINSRAVANQYRAILAQAENEGRQDAVLEITRAFLREVEWVPEEVGESREELALSGMNKRCLTEAPLTIEFAFNEQERVVFITRFHLWPQKPDRQD